MIHYTCDRCKREIDSIDDVRFVVQLEIKPVREESFAPLCDEVDHLSELNEILETAPPCDCGDDNATGHRESFDLCGDCYEQFRRNPLGRELSFALGFSNN
ncbi:MULTISPECIES: hypothetical protein [Crateriforma]|uniref:Uncharacterized protein n=1 Tax=Crateriforma conspicua TaxID=2527996 RepID=A0A5C6FQ94_9PLAN|nr:MULTISPECIES: hypothetical protein [Crateriforma]TWU65297.1 hypothetical protein V7x_08430 [Crateriforma conspicua]